MAAWPRSWLTGASGAWSHPGFCGPAGLAVGTDGTLYAADGISMAAVARDGTQRRVGMLFDGQFPGFVRGLAAAANGNVVVTPRPATSRPIIR